MAPCGRVAPAGQGQLRRPPAHDAPSKIVQWTVVDMTFPNGPTGLAKARRLAGRHPLDGRGRAGGDVAKRARHETIVEDHLTATYLYTWSAVR